MRALCRQQKLVLAHSDRSIQVVVHGSFLYFILGAAVCDHSLEHGSLERTFDRRVAGPRETVSAASDKRSGRALVDRVAVSYY